ncbi:MAG: ABC transporter ATP-binding protein [Spirochaetales bacterium]|nr:ABC transporter ATP-binding protein [Spirochaetales bacterium]
MSRLLNVNNLHTSFFTQDGEIKAVKGVDFHLNKGETLGIVGESGSGKSVTSLSILRLLPPAGRIIKGEIKLGDTDIINLDRSSLRKIRGAKVAMIFQDPMSSLNPLIPVGKQVEEMIRTHENHSKKELKKLVLGLFEKVQIPDPAKRYNSYPHEFSGGMRQRVMIAMALACKPSLLIADEPTTALDVTIQDQILKLLRSLQDEMQMSIIFISHNLGVVAEICSRVLVMYGGMIMEYANIYDIFNNPKHPYTMGLLKSIPSIDQDRTVPLQSIPGSPPDMSNPPKGCPFHPRCRYARKICSIEVPPAVKISEDHGSRCWLVRDDAPDDNNPFSKEGSINAT